MAADQRPGPELLEAPARPPGWMARLTERARPSPYYPALSHPVLRRVLPGAAASALATVALGLITAAILAARRRPGAGLTLPISQSEGARRMPVLPIRLFGDPVLTTPADQVTTFDAELRRLVRNLDETLYDQRGSGLAAPQVGVGLRVFVFHDEDVAGHLVNPVLDFPDDEEQDGPEGCLSIPGLYFDTKRRLNVVAQGFTASGDPVQVVGTGELARCLQHETDHLDGVLFIDRMDRRRRKEAMRAIRAAEWNGVARPAVKISPHPMINGYT